MMTYKTKNPITRHYLYKILQTSVKLARLAPTDDILDFGCEKNELKKGLVGYNVIGYDIEEKYSDIKDYRLLRPDVVFCNSVLEHFDNTEDINNLLKDFKKMNKDMRIIITLPKHILIAKLFLILTRNTQAWAEHNLYYNEIMEVLNKHLIKEDEKTVMLEASITRWRFK